MGQPQQSDWDWNWWMEEFPGDLRIVEGERLSEMWERWKRREGEWIYLESIEKREQGYALVQCRGLQEERMCVVFTLNAIYLYLLDLMMTLVSFHSNSLLLLVHSSHSELWYVVVMLLNPLVTEMKWVKREKEKVRSAWNFERTKFAHDPWKSPFLPFRSMS